MINKIPYLSSRTFFLVASLVFALVVIVGVTSQNQYTYFSRADEGQENIEFTQSAVVPTAVDDAALPSCVRRMDYLNGSDRICFVQYECVENPIQTPQECILESSSLLTCDTVDSCKSIGEWIAQARQICGC